MNHQRLGSARMDYNPWNDVLFHVQCVWVWICSHILDQTVESRTALQFILHSFALMDVYNTQTLYFCFDLNHTFVAMILFVFFVYTRFSLWLLMITSVCFSFDSLFLFSHSQECWNVLFGVGNQCFRNNLWYFECSSQPLQVAALDDKSLINCEWVKLLWFWFWCFPSLVWYLNGCVLMHVLFNH